MPANLTQLTIDLGDARDQGPRPTCLSFSLSEIHRAALSLGELLSPESLHRRAAARAGKSPSDGLTLHEAIVSLNGDGQTTEVDWPYNSDKALNAACAFHCANGTSLPFDHAVVVAALKSKRPISLIIDVDLTFFGYNGNTPLDLNPTSQIQGRHAVVVCGVRAACGSFDYLIKNSWGSGWGNSGYAWLTLKHVSARSPLLVRI